MHIESLLETPSVTISYDAYNQWLYLDWNGDLTLPLVQKSCLLVARCFLNRNCTRILNDNTNVTSVTPDVGAWLANRYLPHLPLAGIEYMAWVHSAGIDTQVCTDTALHELSTPVVAIFHDLASAYGWLRGVKFKSSMLLPPAKRIYRHQQALAGHATTPSTLYIH